MIRIVRLEFSAHAHATEDEDKVVKAVLNLIPKNLQREVKIEKSVAEGHYSNPITRFSLSIDDSNKIAQILRYIGLRMSDLDREALTSTLDMKYDERSGRLYIRFSKQDAYLGNVKIMEGDDVVRLVIVFRGSPSLKSVRDFLRKTGLLS